MILSKKFSRCFLTLVFVQILTAQFSFAQLDSIYDQSVYRTYIVHLPAGYSTSDQYPVVINLHGLNSNAAQQQSYSQFDPVADAMGFIVVYPNGIGNQWDVAGNTDVTFISHLIDTIRADFSCNTCLFITGISDGGFMTFKLACALPQHITAIADVAGNMAVTLQNTCVIANILPLMHFHGTADVIVNYNGVPPLIPPVDTTISWWMIQDSCPISIFMPTPDINLADSCHVVHFQYTDGVNGFPLHFYKIINGGHTWPGASPVPPLGFTNQDINASALMGNFFHSYCSVTQSINEATGNSPRVFPNPAQNSFAVELPGEVFSLSISDMTGRNLLFEGKARDKKEIDCSYFSPGVYLVQVKGQNYFFNKKLIVVR